jgi:hypothetical protein
MSRPSPHSRRPGRSRPGKQRMAISAAARAMLKADYPEVLKQRILLASRGSVRGRCTCALCGEPGSVTRVYVPPEALRPVDPEYGGVRSYWVCAEHLLLPDTDGELRGALARRGKR